jgi:L-malate glycosyltransferase
VRIDQFVPGFAKHDAIGNHALQVRKAFREVGIQSDIWGEDIDPRMSREARFYTECSATADPERLVLYHASTQSNMAPWLKAAAESGQAVAVDYHNITPSRYFARWEPPAARSMHNAREQLASLVDTARLAVADSAFNEAELVALGYSPTAVCPLLVDLEEYHGVPHRRTLASLEREQAMGGAHWLFVGRIAPNKCQHDVIAAFAVYRRLFDPRAKLDFVGGPTSLRYFRELELLIDRLELTGSVRMNVGLPFDELLAHFLTADVFVCLSEHEGFCVPILESMEVGLPVVAYSAAAVGDTVKDGGLLLASKDPMVVACAVADLLDDPARREALVAAGRDRAGEYSLERTSKTMVDTIVGRFAASAE